MEDGVLRSCKGLQNFVRIHLNGGKIIAQNGENAKNGFPTKELGNDGDAAGLTRRREWQKQQEIIIFDNHNHALYFWIDAVRR